MALQLKRSRLMAIWIACSFFVAAAITAAAYSSTGPEAGSDPIIEEERQILATIDPFQSSLSHLFPIVVGTEESVSIIKLQQQWAYEEGIGPDPSFPQFLKRWEQENRRRKSTLNEGRVIFGPQQYDKRTYYSEEYSRSIRSLKDKLAMEWNPSESVLQSYYDTLKDPHYRVPDRIVLQRWSLSAGADSKPEEIILDENTRRSNSELYPVMYAEAAILREGQYSPVYEEGGIPYKIQCISRTPGGYRSYKVVRDHVRSLWIDEKYSSEVMKRMEVQEALLNSR